MCGDLSIARFLAAPLRNAIDGIGGLRSSMYARQIIAVDARSGAPGEHWASGMAPLTASPGRAPGDDALQVFWSGAHENNCRDGQAERFRGALSMYLFHWTLLCASFASPRLRGKK